MSADLESTINGISNLNMLSKNHEDKHTNGSRPLGYPVDIRDFERMVPTDWWKNVFNELYLQTDGDVVEDPEITSSEVSVFVELVHLTKEDRILDLCCGQGRHTLELARRGYRNAEGLDQSEFLITKAQERAASENLPVRFSIGDCRRLPFPASSFNAVLVLGNSFGYSADRDDDRRVLEEVFRVLTPGGRLLLDISDGTHIMNTYEPRSWEWIGTNMFVCRERALSSDSKRLISREVITQVDKGVIADQFYAERLYSEPEIVTLLTELNFKHAKVHGVIGSDSKRNQDLGMMAKRLLVTSNVDKVVCESLPTDGLLSSAVTVILGDPRKPDSAKLRGTWNPEDFAAVTRLKEALALNSEFKFKFLNNHDTLFQELMKDPPKFVLNLCDEGFNNEALMTPNIPATLDIMGIPYSGSDTRCLSACYDKDLVRGAAISLGIPVPLQVFVRGSEDSLNEVLLGVHFYPAIIKPCCADGSLGINRSAVANNHKEATARILKLRQEFPGRDILVQEFLSGREYSVGVLGNTGDIFQVLPIMEIDYSKLSPGLPHICTYESKWDPKSPYWTEMQYKKAELSNQTYQELVRCSSLLFERLRCCDYARFDWRMDDAGRLKLLEVNPNPGWCFDGKLSMMAEYAGMSYKMLLRGIILAAQRRYLKKQQMEQY